VSNSRIPATRAGLVTTLRGAGPVLESFLRYHMALGFSRLYLFFDDPADPAIDIARRLDDGRITILMAGAQLDDEWRECAQYGYYAPHLASEVMARQCLNVEVAVQYAVADRLDWLLHIDADELFHCPGQDAVTHFARLTRKGIERAIYPNFEALPEQESIGDFFREVTLFKVNRNLQPGGRFDAARQALADRFTQFPPNFFLFYSNGKSAARVRPGLVPDGVHRFHAKRFPRPGDAVAPEAGGEERVIGDARVLHYACCGYEQFRDKYRTLGAFGDQWFGKIDIGRSIGNFHLDARNVMAADDEAQSRAFYRSRAMLDSRDEIRELVDAGLLVRFDAIARWLDGTRENLP